MPEEPGDSNDKEDIEKPETPEEPGDSNDKEDLEKPEMPEKPGDSNDKEDIEKSAAANILINIAKELNLDKIEDISKIIGFK